jgi:hypothetical protein
MIALPGFDGSRGKRAEVSINNEPGPFFAIELSLQCLD